MHILRIQFSARHSAPTLPTPREARRRHGIALAVALMAVVLIGTMIAGASYFAMQNGRAADNSRKIVQTTAMAEVATAEVLRAWVPATYGMLNNGDSVTIPLTTSQGRRGQYQGKVYKLNASTYMLDLTAWDSANTKTRGAGARQRLVTLTRTVPLQMPMASALTIANQVIFGGGNSIVAGRDSAPAGWGTGNLCPPPGAAVTGVRAKAAGDILGSSGQYTGNPNASITPGLDSTAYTRFGNTTYDQLAAAATFQISAASMAPGPVVSGTNCVTTTNTNWGDGLNPTAPCGKFFPIVHLIGTSSTTTTLSSGQGQGLLLVDGNLTVSGTWTYFGIVIVKGTFKTTGSGAPKVFGTVLANLVDFSSTSAGTAAAVIDYSSCAITRSMNATSISSPMRSRSYVRTL